MKDWRRILGALIGLAIFVGVVFALGKVRPAAKETVPVTAPLLSDCDGAIRELVIHYLPEADEIALKAYQEFLPKLPASVRVLVVCPTQEAHDKLARSLGTVSCQLVPVVTGHAMTCWSRDRWLALPPVDPKGKTMLLRALSEDGAPVWPAREGDYRTAVDIANANPERIMAGRSELFFDGGDFVADDNTVFVAPNVIRRNSDVTPEQLQKRLQTVLNKNVVMLERAPRHHAGMFMMLVGGKRVLVGDPSLAKGPLKEEAKKLISEIDESADAQGDFDAVAKTCEEQGYTVTRIPVVPGTDSRTYLSYVNVIIDVEDGTPVVYMPTFRGAPKLNAEATKAWSGLGYEVRPIDCTDCYQNFGTLRCLVNVLSR